MTRVDVLLDAMEATGYSARRFARVLDVDERTVRRWLAGDRGVPGPVRQFCRALLLAPGLAAALEIERHGSDAA